MTYNVKDAAAVLSWNNSDATSNNDLTATCGAYTWTVTKLDGSTAIDSTVFTGSYSAATKTLSTYTTSFSKATTYDMLAKVCYTETAL